MANKFSVYKWDPSELGFENFITYINFSKQFDLQYRLYIKLNPYFVSIRLAKPNLFV